MLKNKYNIKAFLLLFAVLLSAVQSFAQVNFTQRTSTQAPAPYTGVTNYNLQGDFTMIGNTNITLVNYSNTGSNNVNMRFVDIDGDNATFNSSSAQLNIPGDECTEIIYAGLYWTGRAQQSAGLGYTFDESRTFGHNDQIEGNATVTVSRQEDSNNDYYPRYTITVGGIVAEIDFTNNTGNNRVQYRIGDSGSFTNIPVSYSSSSNTGTATFTNALTLNIGGQQVTITGLQRDTRTGRSASQYQSTSYITQSTTFDKRKVRFKKEGDNYFDVQAHTVNNNPQILFPNTSNNNYDYIYAAYADVTNYVRANKAGNYFVADIALVEGSGGAVGYIGGWGMVIIYKNPTMKWRDITVFDGYGYMNQAAGSKELPVSGFRAAQNGDVNIKLGMMAAEGDVSISGDYFDIRNVANQWRRINKSDGTTGNTSGTTNFFNSSIMTGGNARNPNLQNNTGLDIVMFDLVNSNNTIIGNGQTSVDFRFGTSTDVYSIFNITFAVDAYVPEVVGENTPANTGTVHGSTVIPGQDLEFDLKIYNKGEEAVNNMKVEIPIPFNLHYAPTATVQVGTGAVTIPGNTTVNWVPPSHAPAGASSEDYPGGTLVWNIGTLPYDDTKSILQGTLKYKLKVTENCALLTSAGPCGLQVKINGKITGTGATSNTAVSSDLVRDYGSGACAGPIYDDFESTINVSEDFKANCAPPILEDGMLQFVAFCSLPGNVFPRAEIANEYPLGTKFFTSQPTSYEQTTNVLTGDFPVNTNGSKTTYYAVVPGMEPGCYIMLQTYLTLVTTSPTADNVTICEGEDVVLDVELSATGVTEGFELMYFDAANATTPLATAPTPTAAGTFTYWVAEGVNKNGTICIGPKVQFTVTINAVPVVQQDVADVSICENNDTAFTITASTPAGTMTYVWEYATATAPTVWNTLDNNTYSGQITVNNGSLNISHAVRVGATSINGIKVRLIAKNSNDCETVSNEVAIEIKDCRAITNPMLPNKAGQN